MQFEHCNIVDGAIDDALHTHGTNQATVHSVRAVLPSEDGLELLKVKQPAGSCEHPLVNCVEACAAFKQKVAAVFKLISRILVSESGTLLLLKVQSEAQAARIDPTLTDLSQAPYSVSFTQGIRDLVQGLERTTYKAVTLLAAGDGFFAGTAFDPFVSVEHHLQGKGRMAAHLDGEVAPLFVDEVKVVMIHIRPLLTALQVRHVTFTAVDLPHQRRCLGHQNQKQTNEVRLLRQISLGELVLALCTGAVD